MDLSTVLSRLQNGFYRRLAALIFDVQLITTNCIVFNRDNSPYSIDAKELEKLLMNVIRGGMGEIYVAGVTHIGDIERGVTQAEDEHVDIEDIG